MKDHSEVIRPANIDDVGGILDLISPLEQQGILVKRSRELLETEIARLTWLCTPRERCRVPLSILWRIKKGRSRLRR